MRALAILCVVPGFSLGLIAGVTHIVGPLEPSTQQTNLVWSNRVFTTREDFETWLASRGSSYELWSQRHPVAARHFDAVSSLAASAQDSRRQVQSGTALLITIISCSALLALLALPRLMGFARSLLDPPSARRRLRGPPSTIVAAVASRSNAKARPPLRGMNDPGRPRSALLRDPIRVDLRRGRTALDSLGRIAPGRAALAAKSKRRLVRHYLPKVAFYVTVVVLSFAVGAWIAIYLQ